MDKKVHLVEPHTDDFCLTDFRQAGFLLSRGASFRGITRNSNHETVFIFKGVLEDGSATAELFYKYPGSIEQRYDAACKSMHDCVKIDKNPNYRKKR